MFISMYNRADPNFRDILRNHWPILGRHSVARNLERTLYDLSQETYFLKGLTGKSKNCITF